MSIQKLPWLSLTLLLLTYSIFGWILAEAIMGWEIRLAVGASLLLIVLTLTAPITLIRVCFGSWLQSDVKAFIAIIFFSLALVAVIVWIKLFARVAVLLAAGALARLDLQRAGYGRWQALSLLAFICLLGYSLGIAVNQLMQAPM